MSALLAGAVSVPITPRAEDLRQGVYLGGFGSYRQRRASGVHDDVHCRALALSDGSTACVLAVLDLVGASGPLLAAIRADAARLTQLPPESILLACTHSHASPDTQGLWGGTPAAYETHVAHRAASAIWQAHSALAPAAIVAATTSLGGVARNRRGWPQTDETLTTLRLTSNQGAPVATLLNYACHPTAAGAANTEVSRDWCGVTVDAVERELGGVALYVNGAIGDVNPAQDGGFDGARSLGEAVAAAAIASLAAADAVSGFLRVRTEPLEIPLNFERLSTRVQDAVGRAGPALSVLSKTGGLRASSLALYAAGRGDLAQIVAALAGISERRLVHRDGGTFLPTHCGYLAIGGGLEALAAPGEVLTRLALPLRASMTAPHRLFLGLTHDTIGYFVPEDEWMTGRNSNYEESVSMGRRAGPTLAQALLRLMPHRQEAP
ncbi:MAG TPA: neutral/alkaline non-lysosomal ceramidase N-terminal domain-containing protein [Dehalococcoidia bacterium]|nr:neutral/alkaline non-lysosomal ceramidase N-terminal domain-containing protein [Dehalococcoidia bacterium]